jgi:hypothetical protein
MGEKLKNLWHNRKRVFTTVLLWLFRFGVPGGIAWIGWLLYDFIYSANRAEIPLEQRIAFVSLWVAIVGFSLAVLGTVIAVLQFQASQRKPDLYLWIDELEKTVVTALTGRSDVYIGFILENRGERVAEHVECFLRISVPGSASGLLPESARVEVLQHPATPPTDSWQLQEQGGYALAAFRGYEAYICYDHDWQILGVFKIPRLALLDPLNRVEYKLRCEGMPRKEGVLWIEVPEDARS